MSIPSQSKQGKNYVTENFRSWEFEKKASMCSYIRGGHVNEKTLGYYCPQCEAFLGMLEHGQYKQCRKCGLEIELWGAALVCTKDISEASISPAEPCVPSGEDKRTDSHSLLKALDRILAKGINKLAGIKE